HRAGRAYRHEHRRFDDAATSGERRGTSLSFTRINLKHQRRRFHYWRRLFFDLCLSIILIGVAKKSNSSRKRFSKCRKNEKCKPAFPPEVNTTNCGGRTPICVMYCTCSRAPPWVFAGVIPLRSFTSRSKKSFSREVATRVL